jgi:WS/DGAT/MGAT family acyltransferase
VGRAANAIGDLVMHPARAREMAGRASSATLALGKLALMAPDPPTPFKGVLGVEKRAVWSSPIDLERVKSIGRKTGATVNDLLIAAVSGALRRYLRQNGKDTKDLEIRAVVPVNLRGPDRLDELGNRFGLIFLRLPLGLEEPLERIFELKKRMNAIKDSPEAPIAFQILRGLGLAPAPLFDLVLGQFGKKATAVMTNVMGPTESVRLAGVRVRQAMFWVPRSAGLGLGVSIFSYCGKVWLGVATDHALVPDPEAILDGFHEELEEMTALVRLVE